MEKTTPCIAGGGLLAAIAAVLRLVGSAIRFGPFSVSLVLILRRAALCWAADCFLVGHCGFPRIRIGDQPGRSSLRAMPARGAYPTVGRLGCPCTLAFTGGLGRFVAPLRRREAVCDEDLLLRGLWKLCTANCPSADKP